MKKGFLLDREMLLMFDSIDEKNALAIIEVISSLGIKERVITKKIFQDNLPKIQSALVNLFTGDEADMFFTEFVGGNDSISAVQTTQTNGKQTTDFEKPLIKLITSPAFPQRKVNVQDFVKHFRSRYELLRSFLEQQDFDNLTTIRKLTNDRNTYTIIGCVLEKRITKNKNIMLTVEDLTGHATVLVNQQKKELFEKTKDIMLDDIVAFEVNGSKDLLFCNNITYPEAYILHKKRHTEDVWIACTSDIHSGSKYFLEKNLLKFVKWLNGEEGDAKFRDIAKKVKYLFIPGDLIDGVNHYPGQEKELNILSCREQYEKLVDILKLIRKDVQIIIGPGDHDAVWLGDPQPIVSEKWAPGFYEMENVHLVPSPAMIEIEGNFRILMYHGKSMNPMIDEMPEIRSKYGHSQPSVVVKEMIKRRHLSPMHGLVDYIPCEIDPMVINPVPDIIITGDQHCADVGTMNNILTIAGSCWQDTTPFMEKVGIISDPCKVPLFNLKTRAVKILDFNDTVAVEEEASDDNAIKEEVIV